MDVLPSDCLHVKQVKLTLRIRKVSFFISYCLPDCSIFQKSVTAPREAEDTVWAYLPRILLGVTAFYINGQRVIK